MKDKQKQKLSIDLMMPQYELLRSAAQQQDVSHSSIVNRDIATFHSLTPEVRNALSRFCGQKQLEAIRELEQGASNESVYHEISQWKNLQQYFYVDPEEGMDERMTKIFLKNGFAVVPKKYVVLQDLGKYEDHMYVGVLTSRNTDQYNVPTFLFPCDHKYARSYTDQLETAVLFSAAKVFPRLPEIYNLQLDVDGDIDSQKWSTAPQFGFFHIVEKGDPLYWNCNNENYEPVDGALIIRCPEVEEE